MKRFQFFVFTALLTLLLSVNVLAAEKEDREGDSATEEAIASSVRTGEVTESFSVRYVLEDGITRYVNFSVDCWFTAEWDEGYGGYISEAVFGNVTDANIDGEPVPMPKVLNASERDGDKYYMEYKINNQNEFLMRVEVCCDEWGEVYLRIRVIYPDEEDLCV